MTSQHPFDDLPVDFRHAETDKVAHVANDVLHPFCPDAVPRSRTAPPAAVCLYSGDDLSCVAVVHMASNALIRPLTLISFCRGTQNAPGLPNTLLEIQILFAHCFSLIIV